MQAEAKNEQINLGDDDKLSQKDIQILHNALKNTTKEEYEAKLKDIIQDINENDNFSNILLTEIGRIDTTNITEVERTSINQLKELLSSSPTASTETAETTTKWTIERIKAAESNKEAFDKLCKDINRDSYTKKLAIQAFNQAHSSTLQAEITDIEPKLNNKDERQILLFGKDANGKEIPLLVPGAKGPDGKDLQHMIHFEEKKEAKKNIDNLKNIHNKDNILSNTETSTKQTESGNTGTETSTKQTESGNTGTETVTNGKIGVMGGIKGMIEKMTGYVNFGMRFLRENFGPLLSMFSAESGTKLSLLGIENLKPSALITISNIDAAKIPEYKIDRLHTPPILLLPEGGHIVFPKTSGATSEIVNGIYIEAIANSVGIMSYKIVGPDPGSVEGRDIEGSISPSPAAAPEAPVATTVPETAPETPGLSHLPNLTTLAPISNPESDTVVTINDQKLTLTKTNDIRSLSPGYCDTKTLKNIVPTVTANTEGKLILKRPEDIATAGTEISQNQWKAMITDETTFKALAEEQSNRSSVLLQKGGFDAIHAQLKADKDSTTTKFGNKDATKLLFVNIFKEMFAKNDSLHTEYDELKTKGISIFKEIKSGSLGEIIITTDKDTEIKLSHSIDATGGGSSSLSINGYGGQNGTYTSTSGVMNFTKTETATS